MEKISAHADGGPRPLVCARETLRSAPHQRIRKFSAACAESPLNISPNCLELISKVSEIGPSGAAQGV